MTDIACLPPSAVTGCCPVPSCTPCPPCPCVPGDSSIIPTDHGWNVWTGFVNTGFGPLYLGLAGVYVLAAVAAVVDRTSRYAGGGRVVGGRRTEPFEPSRSRREGSLGPIVNRHGDRVYRSREAYIAGHMAPHEPAVPSRNARGGRVWRYARGGRMRLTKAMAHYRKATHPGENCGACTHMLPDGRCEVVAGLVDRRMVCDYFNPRGGWS